MNHPIDSALLRAVAVDLEEHLAGFGNPVRLPRPRNDVPFAKRPEGLARRNERRQAQVRRMAWLNS